MARSDDIATLVDRLEIPFNALGVDPYGASRPHLVLFFRVLAFAYRHYFRVRTVGVEHVPRRGRAMVVGNHSGGYAVDAAMVIASALLEMDPPRLAQGMAEKFLSAMPLASTWTCRTGQVPGLPEHAQRLLEDDRLLMVFPEGARGTAKLWKERYSFVDFGTGFVRLALKTRSPIIPTGIIGGGDAVPTVANLYGLGKLLGVPYVPVTPYLLPLPLPVPMEIRYGRALEFAGTGDEEDAVILGFVQQVRDRIAELVEQGRQSLGDAPGAGGRP